jgi:hypothetical protein
MRETVGDAGHRYPPDAADSLAALASAALNGELDRRSPRYQPPSWASAGARLVEALSDAAGGYRSRHAARIRA